MRAIMESGFDILYLVTIVVLGILILKLAKGKKDMILFGLASLMLVCGDAFHLVPRIIGLNSEVGLDGFVASLGIGTLVTSITMTIFYVMVYHFLQIRFGKKYGHLLTGIIWVLAAVRIALCLFPQNEWTSADSPVSWGIYRNIPFLILGIIVIVLLFNIRKEEKYFKFAWIAIILSFLFYIPVVLWADVNPMIGMLMLPKTICYVYFVVQGFRAARADKK